MRMILSIKEKKTMGKEKPPTKELIRRVYQLKGEGKTYNEIMEITGENYKRVQNAYLNHPHPDMPDLVETEENIQKIKEWRLSKKGSGWIAKKLSCSQASILKVFKDHPVEKRVPKETYTSPRQYYINKRDKRTIEENKKALDAKKRHIGDIVDGGRIIAEYDRYYLVDNGRYKTTVHKHEEPIKLNQIDKDNWTWRDE